MAEKLKGDFRKFMDKSFLGAWDLKDSEDTILTIDHVQRDEVKNDRGTEKKMTLHFVEDGYKPMICNTTNAQAISTAHGSTKVEDWERKKIALYKATINAFGQTTECIRVRAYAPKTEDYICADCGLVITSYGKYSAKVIANRALTKFNRYLCYDCAQIAAGADESEASDEPTSD